LLKSDFLIIGAGIIGLSIAKELRKKYTDASIRIIEKESDVSFHASGRNSGVLHAGFYYTKDSLKAKFSKDGNALMKEYCLENNLSLNENKKIVVTQNSSELDELQNLQTRAQINGVDTKIIDEYELKEIEPYAKTFQKALYSTTTATINPSEVSARVKSELQSSGVRFHFSEEYKFYEGKNIVRTKHNRFEAGIIINCAGLYADKIAKEFNLCKDYTILPFKGIYLEYTVPHKIKTNIYPVPNPKNPFLGVHYTVTSTGKLKIGPTAIPALWREHYSGMSKFSVKEMINIVSWQSKLYLKNSFGFRSLAHEEVRKYKKSYMQYLATYLTQNFDTTHFSKWGKAGIRAQLLDTRTNELVQDFVVEKIDGSIHILNAVSPAFTASFAFSKWVVDNHTV